jgi:hypothetical protein
MTKPLHVINYEGKEYRIPFDLDLQIDKDKVIDVPNRFSGEKASLPWFAVERNSLKTTAQCNRD